MALLESVVLEWKISNGIFKDCKVIFYETNLSCSVNRDGSKAFGQFCFLSLESVTHLKWTKLCCEKPSQKAARGPCLK